MTTLRELARVIATLFNAGLMCFILALLHFNKEYFSFLDGTVFGVKVSLILYVWCVWAAINLVVLLFAVAYKLLASAARWVWNIRRTLPQLLKAGSCTAIFVACEALIFCLFPGFDYLIATRKKVEYDSLPDCEIAKKALPLTAPLLSKDSSLDDPDSNLGAIVQEMSIAGFALASIPSTDVPKDLVYIVDGSSIEDGVPCPQIGTACFLKYRGRLALGTARHVIDKVRVTSDVLTLSTGKKAVSILFEDLTPMLVGTTDRADLILYDATVGPLSRASSALGCRFASYSPFSNGAVTIHSFTDQPKVSTSSARSPQAGVLVYSASTVPGTSGAPIYQRGKVVGFHTGADHKQGCNFGCLLPPDGIVKESAHNQAERFWREQFFPIEEADSDDDYGFDYYPESGLKRSRRFRVKGPLVNEYDPSEPLQPSANWADVMDDYDRTRESGPAREKVVERKAERVPVMTEEERVANMEAIRKMVEDFLTRQSVPGSASQQGPTEVKASATSETTSSGKALAQPKGSRSRDSSPSPKSKESAQSNRKRRTKPASTSSLSSTKKVEPSSDTTQKTGPRQLEAGTLNTLPSLIKQAHALSAEQKKLLARAIEQKS